MNNASKLLGVVALATAAAGGTLIASGALDDPPAPSPAVEADPASTPEQALSRLTPEEQRAVLGSLSAPASTPAQALSRLAPEEQRAVLGVVPK